MEIEQIDILLGRHFANETTAAEELELAQWINDHKEEYLLLKTLIADTEQEEPQQVFSVDGAWEKVEPKTSGNEAKKVKLKSNGFGFWYAAAAILIIACGASIFYLYTPITTSTKFGEVKTIKLNDGSLITLNTGSSITYPRIFWSKRNVTLNGEAFFEVKHNADKPFTVTAGKLFVNVLGTSFLVKNNKKEQSVFVESGKVAVKETTTGRSLVLNYGQRAYFNGSKLLKGTFKDDNYLAWKTGILSFENTPLPEVFKMLETHYVVNIKVEKGSGSTCMVTSKFEKESLNEVLKELSLIFGFRYQITGNQVVLSEIRCESDE